MLEKLWSKDIYTTAELFALAEKCARMEEGRLSISFLEGPVAEGDGRGAAVVMRRGAERVAARGNHPSVELLGIPVGEVWEHVRRPHAPWCSVHRTRVHEAHECRALLELSGLRRKCPKPPEGAGLPWPFHGCGQLGHFVRACPTRVGTGGSVRRNRGPIGHTSSSASSAIYHNQRHCGHSSQVKHGCNVVQPYVFLSKNKLYLIQCLMISVYDGR